MVRLSGGRRARAAVARLRPALTAAMALASWGLAGCPITQPQDTPVSEFARIDPATGSKYYLYVPSTYKDDHDWPLVVTLHGTHGFDSAWAQVKRWKALAEEHEFIVLAPQLTSPQGLLYISRRQRLANLEGDEKKTLAAVEDVKRQYRISPRQRLIFGFSAGGYPLYYIGLRNPEVFRALAACNCNCDLEALKTIPITEKVRSMPMLVFFGKTGINPVYSKMSPIAEESWSAYRYLREHRCFQAEIDPIEGGHDCRPDVAYAFWAKHRGRTKEPTSQSQPAR